MALKLDDDNFTHVIAIDFGTGASGYISFKDYYIFTLNSYGIAPKHLEANGKPRIEVFNPCDETDDQKTPTAILFDNN